MSDWIKKGKTQPYAVYVWDSFKSKNVDTFPLKWLFLTSFVICYFRSPMTLLGGKNSNTVTNGALRSTVIWNKDKSFWYTGTYYDIFDKFLAECLRSKVQVLSIVIWGFYTAKKKLRVTVIKFWPPHKNFENCYIA